MLMVSIMAYSRKLLSLQHAHGVHDAFDLLDMLLFMICQPLGICIYSPFAAAFLPSSPSPSVTRLRAPMASTTANRSACGYISLQRGLKFLLAIVRVFDPGSRIDSLKRGPVLAEYHQDVLAPHVRTGAEMSKHISGGPFTGLGRGHPAR